jgi:hypothetical protein
MAFIYSLLVYWYLTFEIVLRLAKAPSRELLKTCANLSLVCCYILSIIDIQIV